jgi:hypothetical protein
MKRIQCTLELEIPEKDLNNNPVEYNLQHFKDYVELELNINGCLSGNNNYKNTGDIEPIYISWDDVENE